MSVSVLHGSTIKTTEVIGNNTGDTTAANRTIIHDQYDVSETLDGTTTPAVTQVAGFLMTLVAGAKTIDLTALVSTNGATLSGSGLKVQLLRIKNLGANAMTIKGGAANGHDMFGSTDGIVIQPGGILHIKTNGGGTSIDATHKNWDVTGTTTQTAQFTILLG